MIDWREMCIKLFNRCYAVSYPTMCLYCGMWEECEKERTIDKAKVVTEEHED